MLCLLCQREIVGLYSSSIRPTLPSRAFQLRWGVDKRAEGIKL